MLVLQLPVGDVDLVARTAALDPPVAVLVQLAEVLEKVEVLGTHIVC